MPTYVYETLPDADGKPPERFEIVQSMKDAPLQLHPTSKRPVRRIITGGYFVPKKSGVYTADQHDGGDCCGTC